jgi:hypothetical protein
VHFSNPVVSISATLNSDPIPEPTSTPEGAISITQSIQVTPSDFLVNLVSVEVLPTKAMRWTFELWNKTSTSVPIIFHNNSYVTDDLGNRYAVVKELFVQPSAGERIVQSVDFEAPKPGAKVFTLYWGGGSGVHFSNPVIQVALTFP